MEGNFMNLNLGRVCCSLQLTNEPNSKLLLRGMLL